MILLNRRNEVSLLIGFISGFLLCYVFLRLTNPAIAGYEHLNAIDLAPPESVQRHLAQENNENHVGHHHEMMNFSEAGHSHDNGEYSFNHTENC